MASGHVPVKSTIPSSNSPQFGDMNILHLQTVQKYQKPPYHLKTDVRITPHGKQFMATLEWKWTDPRTGKPVSAITTGIQSRRKWAVAEACKAMLEKHNMQSSQPASSGISHVDRLVQAHEYTKAASELIKLATKSPEVSRILPSLWKGLLGIHDFKSVYAILDMLDTTQLTPSCYESLLQSVVFVGDSIAADRLLSSMVSRISRISLTVPVRGLDADSPSIAQVVQWQRWRSLIALEEQASMRESGSGSIVMRRDTKSTTFPVIKLLSSVGTVEEDSIVLLGGDSGRGLIGQVESVKFMDSSVSAITVKLLSEEGRWNNELFLADEIKVTRLSESRVNFERINDTLREFFRISQSPDPSFAFVPGIVDQLLGGKRRLSSSQKSPRIPPHMSLCASQREAVKLAMTEPITLVHGPPGTGKTHTICGIISAWRADDPWKRILACADSNTAADNIFFALRRKGVSCFRLTATGNVLDPIDDAVLDQIPNKDIVRTYRRVFRDTARSHFSLGPLIGARKKVEAEAIKHFHVIVTTLSTSRSVALNKSTFPRVIIDEAAQTMEPSALMALSRGCEQLVLVGDHKQLPAVVLSSFAAKRGLDVSLFERLMDSATSVLLSNQRRMHPSIAEFSNSQFYDGKIVNHESVEERDAGVGADISSPLISLLSSPRRVVFVDTCGAEETIGTSTRNQAETEVIIGIMKTFLKHNQDPGQVGIIVPYLAQKNFLTSKLSRAGLLSPDLQINTVEGFQGHEKDYIIISTVRSNAQGFLGFVEDDQRMNVMLTRARKGLVVVGDKATLEKKEASIWKKWILWCTDRGHVVQHKDLGIHID